jgi:hypothetical protein
VTSPQGCTDTSACVNITGLGIDEELNVGVELHPMPFSSDLTISGLGEEPVEMTVFSLDGRVVYFDPKATNGTIALNIPSGQYILSVANASGTIARRIIRE